MTAAEAHAAAAAEGLALVRRKRDGPRANRGGKHQQAVPGAAEARRAQSTWAFTAEEAAPPSPASSPEGVAAALVPPEPAAAPMTAAEAHAAADAEGLLLVRAENPTGFKGGTAAAVAASRSRRAVARRAQREPGRLRDGGGGGAGRRPPPGRSGVAAALAADEAKGQARRCRRRRRMRWRWRRADAAARRKHDRIQGREPH